MSELARMQMEAGTASDQVKVDTRLTPLKSVLCVFLKAGFMRIAADKVMLVASWRRSAQLKRADGTLDEGLLECFKPAMQLAAMRRNEAGTLKHADPAPEPAALGPADMPGRYDDLDEDDDEAVLQLHAMLQAVAANPLQPLEGVGAEAARSRVRRVNHAYGIAARAHEAGIGAAAETTAAAKAQAAAQAAAAAEGVSRGSRGGRAGAAAEAGMHLLLLLSLSLS